MTEQELSKLRDTCIQLGKIIQRYDEKKYYISQIKVFYDIFNYGYTVGFQNLFVIYLKGKGHLRMKIVPRYTKENLIFSF